MKTLLLTTYLAYTIAFSYCLGQQDIVAFNQSQVINGATTASVYAVTKRPVLSSLIGSTVSMLVSSVVIPSVSGNATYVLGWSVYITNYKKKHKP